MEGIQNLEEKKMPYSKLLSGNPYEENLKKITEDDSYPEEIKNFASYLLKKEYPIGQVGEFKTDKHNIYLDILDQLRVTIYHWEEGNWNEENIAEYKKEFFDIKSKLLEIAKEYKEENIHAAIEVIDDIENKSQTLNSEFVSKLKEAKSFTIHGAKTFFKRIEDILKTHEGKFYPKK